MEGTEKQKFAIALTEARGDEERRDKGSVEGVWRQHEHFDYVISSDIHSILLDLRKPPEVLDRSHRVKSVLYEPSRVTHHYCWHIFWKNLRKRTTCIDCRVISPFLLGSCKGFFSFLTFDSDTDNCQKFRIEVTRKSKQIENMEPEPENMESIEPTHTCPYNKYHKILILMMPAHLDKCRKKYYSELESKGERPILIPCRWNSSHVFPNIEIVYHENNCWDKSQIGITLPPLPPLPFTTKDLVEKQEIPDDFESSLKKTWNPSATPSIPKENEGPKSEEQLPKEDKELKETSTVSSLAQPFPKISNPNTESYFSKFRKQEFSALKDSSNNVNQEKDEFDLYDPKLLINKLELSNTQAHKLNAPISTNRIIDEEYSDVENSLVIDEAPYGEEEKEIKEEIKEEKKIEKVEKVKVPSHTKREDPKKITFFYETPPIAKKKMEEKMLSKDEEEEEFKKYIAEKYKLPEGQGHALETEEHVKKPPRNKYHDFNHHNKNYNNNFHQRKYFKKENTKIIGFEKRLGSGRAGENFFGGSKSNYIDHKRSKEEMDTFVNSHHRDSNRGNYSGTRRNEYYKNHYHYQKRNYNQDNREYKRYGYDTYKRKRESNSPPPNSNYVPRKVYKRDYSTESSPVTPPYRRSSNYSYCSTSSPSDVYEENSQREKKSDEEPIVFDYGHRGPLPKSPELKDHSSRSGEKESRISIKEIVERALEEKRKREYYLEQKRIRDQELEFEEEMNRKKREEERERRLLEEAALEEERRLLLELEKERKREREEIRKYIKKKYSQEALHHLPPQPEYSRRPSKSVVASRSRSRSPLRVRYPHKTENGYVVYRDSPPPVGRQSSLKRSPPPPPVMPSPPLAPPPSFIGNKTSAKEDSYQKFGSGSERKCEEGYKGRKYDFENFPKNIFDRQFDGRPQQNTSHQYMNNEQWTNQVEKKPYIPKNWFNRECFENVRSEVSHEVPKNYEKPNNPARTIPEPNGPLTKETNWASPDEDWESD